MMMHKLYFKGYSSQYLKFMRLFHLLARKSTSKEKHENKKGEILRRRKKD
jgi:hypothetical protein